MSVTKYLLRFSWKNLTDNRLMNIVAFGTTAMALLIMGGVLLVHQNSTMIIRRMKAEAPLIVFLEEGVRESDWRELQSRLLSRAEISEARHKSSDEALQEFRQRLGGEAGLLEGLTRNPLPASLHLRLQPEYIEKISDLAEEINDWDGVESVDYGRDIVERIQALGQVIQFVLAVIGIIICVVAVFIIFNTIQLSVVSRSTEIEILKLVGATRLFIGFPFVVGGVIHGLFGSLLAQGLLWLLYWVAASRLAALPFLGTQIYFLTGSRIALLVVLGTLLGVVGSVTAIYRSVRHM
ncbi:MAG: cell division protein FtsX [bacterium]